MATSTIKKNTMYIREVACTIPSSNATRTMSFDAGVSGHSLVSIVPKQDDGLFNLQVVDDIVLNYSIANYARIQILGQNKNLIPSVDRTITFICVYN